MQSGELIVTGTDSVRIPLKGVPNEVNVRFKDYGPVHTPCDPGHLDFLEYEVLNTDFQFVLLITWSVSSVREIKWHVAY